MMFVVIDTNVIVSALLARNRSISNPFRVLTAVFEGDVTPVLTEAIMSEYIEVLNRPKFNFDKKKIKVLLSELKKMAIEVKPEPCNVELPDGKDVCFYEAALSYKEQSCLLVTGNMKHFPDCPFAVSPAQLAEKLEN